MTTPAPAKKKVRGKPFPKGHTMRQEGKCGRKKGTPNKITKDMAEAFREVFDLLGGVEGMRNWVLEAKANKTIFYAGITPRLVPQQSPVQVNNFNALSRDTLSDKVLESASGTVSHPGNGEDRSGAFAKPAGETH